jgi:Putative Flp pilus-assembly TadE/G-like
MKTLRNESGQVLVLTALCMTVLLGFLAFATDVGTLLYDKRVIQSAADGAAMAGASEIHWGARDGTTPAAAAQAAAAKSGFTNGSGGAIVTVNPPPLSGPHTGDGSYVEVIITQTEPTFFMKLFNHTSMNVAARAVAGLGGINTGCIFAVDPTAPDAIQLQGSFNVVAPNCGIVVNSNNPNALHFTGAGGTLVAQSVSIVGGDSGQTGDILPPTTVTTGVAQTGDPLGFVTPPDPGSLTCNPAPGGILTGTVGPASFGTVCYSGNVLIKDATLNSGTYVFTGTNITLGGIVKTGPGGATIDINIGTLAINTGTTLNLTAPTASTDPYQSIALMQPIANTNPITIQKGDATGFITGDIYAPGAQLFLQDSGGGAGLTLTTDLIVKTLFDKTATINVTSYSQANPGSTLLTVPVLVE